MPVANVPYDDHTHDLAMRTHADKLEKAICRGAGAARTITTLPYPSTHNLETNHMTDRSENGMVNRRAQSHEVRNPFISSGSQFTTRDAENPTPSIVALALRHAEHLAGLMSRKEV